MKTRRDFLANTSLGIVGAAVLKPIAEQNPAQQPAQEPAGMPPAFGTANPAGPELRGLLERKQSLMRRLAAAR